MLMARVTLLERYDEAEAPVARSICSRTVSLPGFSKHETDHWFGNDNNCTDKVEGEVGRRSNRSEKDRTRSLLGVPVSEHHVLLLDG